VDVLDGKDCGGALQMDPMEKGSGVDDILVKLLWMDGMIMMVVVGSDKSPWVVRGMVKPLG